MTKITANTSIINTIYKITFKNNHKYYIGQTWLPMAERLQTHISASRSKNKDNMVLLSAIKEHGEENLSIELLTITHTQEMADHWEIYFIAKYNAMDTNVGYNISPGGRGGKHSLKTREKMSNSHAGVPLSPSHCASLSAAMKKSDHWKQHLIHAKGGEENISAKLTYDIADQIRQQYNDGALGKDLAAKYSVSLNCIYRVLGNETYVRPGSTPIICELQIPKLNRDIADLIREEFDNGISIGQLAKHYKVAASNVSDIVNNTRWINPNYIPKIERNKKWATKLNQDIADNIRKDYTNGILSGKLAKKYGVGKSAILRILRNKTWVRPT